MTVARPEHQVCSTNVAVPTILVEPFKDGGVPEVFVQWFGHSSEMNLGEIQFRFPVPESPSHSGWRGRPDLFQVIMLGQLKDWPEPRAISNLADGFGITTEAWVLWVASKHCNLVGQKLACFALHMTAMLADPNCGVITPRHYCDTTVLENLKKTAHK